MPRKKTSKKTSGDSADQAKAGPSFWSGTISFGLVTVPVQLFPANRSGGVHLRMLDADGTPLRRRYFCPEHDAEVRDEELVRGYEIASGEYVVVTDEELRGLAPRKTRDIDLRAFVDVDQLDPLYFERSYFLAPASESNKAYRLLADAMERTRQAGVATFVMRDREYLVAIISEGGILRAETLRFQDEVRAWAALGLPKLPAADEKRVGAMAGEIRKLKGDRLKESELRDSYADAVRKLVERKRKHDEGVVASAVKGSVEEDAEEKSRDELLDFLMRSLKGSGPAPGKRKPAGRRKAGGRKKAAGRRVRKSA